MAEKNIRVGLIGAGDNMRRRHIPGLQQIDNVEIVAVCNRRPESTIAVAREYGIARTHESWQQLIADPNIDAVVIGTWPYLHCPITLAALDAGKHVLTEARMAMNASEARQMQQASLDRPELVTQIVPSPFGFKGHEVVRDWIGQEHLGIIREIHVRSMNAALADPAGPLSWRQDAALSGVNMLTLGIVHETLLRWVASPIQVMAQVHAHIESRIDPSSGVLRPVGTPDSVQVLAILPNGTRVTYHFSGVTEYGQTAEIQFFGSDGVLRYDLTNDRLYGASRRLDHDPGKLSDLIEVAVPADKALGWRVEEEFIEAIREGTPIEFTDFGSGVAYMEFTEAVAQSAQEGVAIDLPLEEE